MSLADGTPVDLNTAWTRSVPRERTRFTCEALAATAEFVQEEANYRLLFKKAAGISIERFKRMATAGVSGVEHAAVLFDKANNRFQISYGGELFSDSYTLNFKSGIVGGGNIENQKPDRSTGRYMFGLRVMTGLTFGFRTVGLAAANMMGGYTWARAGVFVEKTQRDFLSGKLERRLKAIQYLIPAEVYAQALTLIDLKSDTDLLRIAHLDQRIEKADVWWDGVRQMENQLGSTHRHYMMRGFLPQDRSMTLGQFMLYGMDYDAYIDLKNRAQLRRIAHYTGVPLRRMALVNRIKNALR